jgi:ABC-type lipoprotein release transport system permease subunit
VRREIESLGQECVVSTKTVEQVTGELLASERVNAMLCSFFAGLALLLASIGLYGLMSYGVTRRTREIGVRVALGAQQVSVLWMILRETLGLALVGIAIVGFCTWLGRRTRARSKLAKAGSCGSTLQEGRRKLYFAWLGIQGLGQSRR